MLSVLKQQQGFIVKGDFLEVNENIFREYDIRGLVDRELDEELMFAIGRAYASFLHKKRVKKAVLGYDNRLTSEAYSKAIVKGLLSSGVKVINLGLCTSPVMYFARKHLKIDGGIMITASHNSKEFNGIKLAHGKGCIFGADIQEILKIIKRKDFVDGSSKEEKMDLTRDYVKNISNKVKLARKLKVVLDCGNGTGSIVSPQLIKDLGCEVIELYCESDGTFPNHHPDPTVPETLQDLIARVKEEKADLGIGIDGDGDRIGVVDEKGSIVWGDQLMILFSREVLAKHQGAKILMEVKCSQALWEEIEKHGGKPILSKTGHSLIEAKMHEEGALLAGEMSGHIYFGDEYFAFDDALYAAARLLRILSNSQETISEMLATAPQYFSTPEIRLDCSDKKKFVVVESLKKIFKEKYETIDIDGARVLFPGGWALMRASNTQAKLIVRMEAKTREKLGEIKEEVYAELKKFPEIKFTDD